MEDARLTFHEHLGELRTRLVRIAIAVLAGFFLAWAFRQTFFDLLSAPVREGLADNGIYRLTAIEVTETIFVYLKLSIVAAIILASPVVFWQLWAFVAPGLHRHEKQYILPITVFSILFFLLGVLFCHRVLLPFVTDFLVEMTLEHPDVNLQVTVQNTFSFALSLMLAFGVAFELPLVLFFLAVLGIATPRRLARFFRYFVLLSFVIAALFTPPDPVSQLMMAGPLIALYIVGIGLSALAVRQKARAGRGTLSPASWALVALVLLSIVGGLGYVSWALGRTPTPLDHVPASARAVAGIRWADARNRAALDDALAAWSARHPGAPAPGALLERAGLPLAGGDEGERVTEILLFVTHDDRVAALVTGDVGTDPVGRAAERLGAGWSIAEGPAGRTLVRDDDDPADPAGLIAARVDADVVAVGQRGALAASRRAALSGGGLSSVAHRRDAVEQARRAGPLWLLAWRDPIRHHDLFEILVGTWDRPLIQAWTEVAGDVTVHAELSAPSTPAAARSARQLDQWREQRRAHEAREAAERARAAHVHRTAQRLDRLAAAVEEAVRGTKTALAAGAPGVTPDVAAPLAALEALRTELRGELTPPPPPASATAGGALAVADVQRLEASADGPIVTVVARLTPGGAASLADLLVGWLRADDPVDRLFPALARN